MKNKTFFYKIFLSIFIIMVLLILILSILGSINRIGYLSNLSINTDDTLKLNNIDLETTKKLFYLNDKLNYSLLTNYIFTNSNISKYSYNFKIRYYSKVFGNSDIYGVYLNTNSFPDYISSVKFQEKGSPFGILISSKIIEQEKIDSIKYFLKIKYNIFIVIIIYLCFILFYYFNFIIFDFIKLIYNIRSCKKINLKNKYLYILLIFLCFLIMPNVTYKLFYDKFDHTNYENRKFTEKPKLDLKNLDNYPKLYETYFNDYIPFRNELIKLKRTLDILLFNRIPLYRSSYGIDRNEFWNSNIIDYFGIVNINTNDLLQAKNNLLKFQKKLEEKNIDFVLMVAPSKVVIYDDKFPHLIKKIGNITTTELILKYLNDNLDINIVYPKNELIKYKNNYQLYWKNDPHWNTLSGYISYKYLMKELNILDTLSDIKNIKMTKISNRIEMNKVYNTYLDNIDYDYYIENFSTNKIIDIENKKYFYRKSTSINKINAIFVIDSFGMYMRNFMDNNFANITTVVLNYNQDFNFNTNFNIDKDTNIIIFETVEHLLMQRLLNLF